MAPTNHPVVQGQAQQQGNAALTSRPPLLTPPFSTVPITASLLVGKLFHPTDYAGFVLSSVIAPISPIECAPSSAIEPALVENPPAPVENLAQADIPDPQQVLAAGIAGQGGPAVDAAEPMVLNDPVQGASSLLHSLFGLPLED